VKILSYETLHAKRKSYHPEPGIYILWDGNDVVYVGKTEACVEGRLAVHKYDKEFDSYTFIPVNDLAELEQLETEYIYHFSPKYNRAIPSNPYYKTRAILQAELGINGWDFRRLTREHDIVPNSMGYYDKREFSDA